MPPANRRIRVAVTISPGVQMIDFAGPWEVFQDVMAGDGAAMDHPFELFTVAEKIETIRGSGGLQLIPDHTFENAPAPAIVVVPAQRGSPALVEWLRRVAAKADVTMSVCTGAFHLARTGLLDGRKATTHHEFFDRFAAEFPKVELARDVRFVEHDRLATSAGLSSGIDLALRVVERYFGRAVAEATAAYMEYQGRSWIT